jgi:hypothetical protein
MKQLITTREELQQFTGASAALSIDSLKPYLSNSLAERELLHVLTPTLYNSLLSAYFDNSIEEPANAHLATLLPLVQKPLVNLAIYYYLQEGSVRITDAGIETNRDKTAFAWQADKVEQVYLDHAYFGIDALISHLLAYTNDFATWASSSAFTEATKHLVRNAATFQESVNIGRSHRTFLALLPMLKNVEQGAIVSLLGDDFFSEVLTAYQAGNLGANETALLTKLQPAICYLTMAEAITDLNISLTADGAFQHSLKSNTQNSKERKPAAENDLDRYRLQMLKRGEEWLERCRKYLNAKASESVFSTYYNSDLYEDPSANGETYSQDFDSTIYNGL